MILVEPSAGACMMIAAQLAGGVPENARHLVPIWRAVAESDVALATVMQNDGRFTIPEGRPAILLVGDDLAQAKGPRAFSERSLRAFLPRCQAVAFMGGDALPWVYAAVAKVAAENRRCMCIIESQPEHARAWMDIVEKAAPGAKFLLCLPHPEAAPRDDA